MSARRDAAANQPGPSSGFRSQFLRRVEKPGRGSDSESGSLVSAMSHMGSETPRQSHNLPESDESSVDEHAAGPSARPDPAFVVPGAEARVPSSCDPKIRLPPHLNLTSSEKRRKFSRQEAVSEQTSDEKLNPNNKLFGEFDSSDDESGSAKCMGSAEDDFMMEVAEHVSKRVELTYVPNMVVHDLTSEGLGYSKVLVCDEFAAYGTPNGAIQLTLKTAMEPNFLGRDYRDRSPISEDHINVIFDDFSKSLKDAESSGWAHESAELTGHRTAVTSMAYCHRYSVLFSGVLDGEIRGWDAFNHRCIQNYESHTGIVWDLAVCPGGESFASASEDSTVKLYTLSRPDPLRIFVGHWRGIQKIAFAPDGLRVASASGDFSVKVFDVNSGGGVCHLEHSHSSVVNSLDYSACGNYMAIACQDASLSVWDLRNRRRSLFCRGNAPIISASFSFDGTSILSLQENGDMYSYEFSTDGPNENVPHYVLPLGRNRYKPVSFARDFHGPNFRLVRCPMRTVPARPVAAFGYAC